MNLFNNIHILYIPILTIIHLTKMVKELLWYVCNLNHGLLVKNHKPHNIIQFNNITNRKQHHEISKSCYAVQCRRFVQFDEYPYLNIIFQKLPFYHYNDDQFIPRFRFLFHKHLKAYTTQFGEYHNQITT